MVLQGLSLDYDRCNWDSILQCFDESETAFERLLLCGTDHAGGF